MAEPPMPPILDDMEDQEDTATIIYPSPPSETVTMDDMQTVWGDVEDDVTIDMSIKGKPLGVATHSSVELRQLSVINASDVMTPPPHFILKEKLGEGGMGVVFEAEQTSFARTVAVKMIKAGRDNSESRAKFLSEAVVQGELDHPNIPPAYELGRNEAGEMFFAMKKISGTPWSETIGETLLRENVGILLRVSDAISFAHAKGIVHRDLKPENVMLGEYGEVLLMDWGLAVSITEEGRADRLCTDTPGGGTIAYMAPEMASGKNEKIGFGSDVYLLGAILYEIVTGNPPHTGSSVREGVMNAANNVIVPTEKRGELVQIALKAMATEPEDRYETVDAFRTAVRAYQRHAESLLLSEQAQRDLETAGTTRNYDDYAQSIFGFKQAIELWSGNRQAITSLITARTAHAACAFEKGDYAIALSALEAGKLTKTALFKKIENAKKEREKRIARARTMTHIALGLLLFILIGGLVGGYWIQREQAKTAKALAKQADEARKANAARLALFEEEKKRQEEWLPVCDFDFSKETKLDKRFDLVFCPRDLLHTENRIQQSAIGQAAIKDNTLLLSGRLPSGKKGLSVMRWTEDVGDDMQIECEIPGMSFAGISLGGDSFHGYRIIYDAHHNAITMDTIRETKCTVLATNREPLPTPGDRRVIHMEKTGSFIRVWVDGELVLEFFDPLILSGPTHRTFSLSAYFSTMKAYRLQVWRRRNPEFVPVLETARELLRRKRFTDANDFLKSLTQSYAQSPIALEGEILRGLSLNSLGDKTAALDIFHHVAKTKISGAEKAKVNRIRASAFHEISKIHLADNNFLEAAIAAQEAYHLDPGSLAPTQASQGMSDYLRRHANETVRGSNRSVSHLSEKSQIGILTAISHLPITQLNLDLTGISTLAPLREMKLAILTCGGNRIESLSPLAGMPMEMLNCAGNQIRDLTPLRRMPLTSLDIKCNQISDLTPLRGMRLSALHCTSNLIEDLSPLKGMPLKMLYCGGNKIKDLSALKGMPLQTLECDNNRILSLSPLAEMPLRLLNCCANDISVLNPLKGISIKILNLSDNRITSLAALQGMPLTWLDCSNNRIEDLSPLSGMPLQTLACVNNPIETLSPLTGLPLTRVNCGKTLVVDLSPLNGMTIDSLACNVPLSKENQQTIRSFPLKNIALDFHDAPSVALVRSLPSLTVINGHDSDHVVPILDAMQKALKGRKANLRRYAKKAGLFYYLAVPLPVERGEAIKIAQLEGGYLASPSNHEKAHALQVYIREVTSGWINYHFGLTITSKDGRLRWESGEKVITPNWTSPRAARRAMENKTALLISKGRAWGGTKIPDYRCSFIIEWPAEGTDK